MKLLFHSLETFNLDSEWSDFSCYLRVETDGETMLVTLGYQSTEEQSYSGSLNINLKLKYNGYTRTINANPFGEKQSVTFPYDDNVKTLNVSGMTIFYDETTYTDGKDFTWRTSFDSILPEVTFIWPGPRYKSSNNVSWNISDPLGRPTACVGLQERWNEPAEGFWKTTDKIIGKYTNTSVGFYVSSYYDVGTLMYHILYVGVYETADAAREDYISLVEVVSPVYVVSNQSAPYAPFDIQCRTPVVRAPLKVTWQYISDPSYPASKGFELERSINGGDFALVYAGTSTSFTDTIPVGSDTVQYRVRALGSNNQSVYSTGELLDTVLSNLYTGVKGAVKLAAGLFVGENGAVKQITPIIDVGGA